MAHKHEVIDTDKHFIIDPVTMGFSTESKKTTLMQGDHNCERFTFEIPRFIDKHDMSLCNRVEIHTNNTNAATRVESRDIYLVDDLEVVTDDTGAEIVVFSWLVNGNCTKYAGILSFRIRFACLTDDTIDYQKWTSVNSSLKISDGFSNADYTVAAFSDILNPINCYSRQLKQLKLQIASSIPLKKKLWQQIVRSKIINQAKCLIFCEKDGSEELKNYVNSVKSGDTSNVEGRAAAFYFKKLFGENFRRAEDTQLNAALNYGYAIIRAVICRTLCLYGFEPSLGIHHCNELNNFNLADDIIEPFRPLIDMVVTKTLFDQNTFDTRDKSLILKSLNAKILINNQKLDVTNAIEKVIQSYIECLKTGNNEIIMPCLIDLEYKAYE